MVEKFLMEELLKQVAYQPKPLNRGQILEGTIVRVNPSEALVDIGAKAEGIISAKEAKEESYELKVGDKITVYVVKPEGEGGQAVLSLKKTVGTRNWRDLEEAYQKGTQVEVSPLELNRGGLVVTIRGLRGFIPSSHLSSAKEELNQKSLLVKIIDLDKDTNKLVFSPKGAEARTAKSSDLSKIKEGEIYPGKITRLAPYGVFVSLEVGAEGLAHISELSKERVFDPAELYQVGDPVKVKVLGVDQKSNRVNLSIKQAGDPWDTAHERYIPGNKVQGLINKVTPSGMVVRLEPGVEGLVYFAEKQKIADFKIGEKIPLIVESLFLETKRLTLKILE